MRNRMQGLKSECDLLLADLNAYQAGERHEYDLGPDGQRIDITDLWIDYIKARLAMKKSLIQKLKGRYQDAGVK